VAPPVAATPIALAAVPIKPMLVSVRVVLISATFLRYASCNSRAYSRASPTVTCIG